MAEEILVERRDGVATVTFNRPDQRNAVSFDGWLELRRIAEELDRDVAVKAVVLTGAGEKAFSAGADIKDFELYRNDSESARTYAAAFDGAMDAVEALSKPTISMIRGFCVGGGCELSMATDIRVAADNGRFGIPVARLGILVGYKEMRRLVNLVGPGNASYILLSARLLDADEALRIGLVTRVLPLDEVEEFTYTLAEEMAPLAPLSQRRHKLILQTVLRNPSLGGLSADEEHLPFANFDSEDFHEGRSAFLERRPPQFKGR
ncbi:MAG: enoyl-CoA hydratase/isomerase family protein [Chloroflexi bacterium]|nr:enoyl-CoA hydratase/isomerase family protein [Chloroflexota bacterium]